MKQTENTTKGVQMNTQTAPTNATAQLPAQQEDAVFQASLDFIGTLTGLVPPPIEVAPPEVFKPFRDFTKKVCGIFTTPAAKMLTKDEIIAAIDAADVKCVHPGSETAQETAMAAVTHFCKLNGIALESTP